MHQSKQTPQILLLSIMLFALTAMYGCSSGGNCNLQSGPGASTAPDGHGDPEDLPRQIPPRIFTLIIADRAGNPIPDVNITVDHLEYFTEQPYLNSDGKLVYELKPTVPEGTQFTINFDKPGWYFDSLVVVVGNGEQITHPNGYDEYPEGTIEIPRIVTGHQVNPDLPRYFDLDIRYLDETRITNVTYQVIDHQEYISNLRTVNGHFVYDIAPNVPDGASFTIRFEKPNHIFEDLVVTLDGNRFVHPNGSTTFYRVAYGYIPLSSTTPKQISTWLISSAHFCTYGNGLVAIPEDVNETVNPMIEKGFYMSINAQGGPVIAKMDYNGDFTIFAGTQRTYNNPNADDIADYATGTATDDGTLTTAKFGCPTSLAISSNGRYLYVTDFVNYSTGTRISGFYVETPITTVYGHSLYDTYIKKMARVRKIDTVTKTVTTLVDFNTVLGAIPKSMAGLALSPNDNTLYVGVGYAIYAVNTSTGAPTLFAGSYNTNGNNNGPAVSARFEEICDLAVSPDGTVYAYEFAHVGMEIDNNIPPNPLYFEQSTMFAYARGQIRKINSATVSNLVDTTQNLTRKAIGGFLQEGCGVALETSNNGDTLYATNGHSVVSINPNNGAITSAFGNRETNGEQDGIGTNARLNFPHGLAMLPNGQGMLMMGDYDHYVKHFDLTTTKQVTTLFGGDEGFHCLRPGRMTMQPLAYPLSMCFSKDGQYVFIADAGTIDSTTYAEIMSYDTDTDDLATFCGSSTAIGQSNIGAGTFTAPVDMVMHPNNSKIYVLDGVNGIIRCIERTTKMITTPGSGFTTLKHCDISASGDFLYVTDGTTIKSVNTSTWAQTTIYTQGSTDKPLGIIVNGNELYFSTEQGNIRSVSTSGGIATNIATGLTDIDDIALSTDGNYLYAVHSYSITGIEISSGTTFTLAGDLTYEGYKNGSKEKSRFGRITNLIKYPDSDILFICDYSNSMVRRVISVATP